MKIELKQIKVRDIVSGYTNNEEEGVTGFNGSLNIRPPYQREFVYKDKQQKAVISTIVRGFPLTIRIISYSTQKVNNYRKNVMVY